MGRLYPCYETEEELDRKRAEAEKNAITEARDRCRSALTNSGFAWPSTRRVTILLSPKQDVGADKYGYGFDVNDADGIAGHGGGTVGVSNNFDMFTGSGWSAIQSTFITPTTNKSAIRTQQQPTQ